MGDNFNFTQGAGSVGAADELVIGGVTVKVQRMKLVTGADGVYQGDFALGAAAKTASVPVTLATDEDKANLLTTATSHKAVEVLDAADFIFINGTVYQLTATPLLLTASGNTQVVAADAAKKIRVVGAILSADAAVNVKFQRATTDIGTTYYLAAKQFIELPRSAMGYGETNTSEALNINLSGAVNVGAVILTVKI